jgi:hypothetical protein
MTTTTSPTTARPRTADPARTTVRLEHTRELLSLLPHQLGFRPRDSVALVALRPPGRSVGLIARVDVADLLGQGGPGTARGAVAHLAADGAREVVVVVYDDRGDPRDASRGLRVRPGSDAVRAAEVARSAAARVGPVTVWWITGEQYLGLDCRDGGCCPPGGRPLSDLSAGELAGQLLGRGAVAAGRDEVGLIRPAPPGPRRSAAAARSRWLDCLLRADDSAQVLHWRQRSLDAWRTALAVAVADPGASTGSAVLGRVEAGLLDPVVRDAVVLTLVGADEELPDALLRTAPDVFDRGGSPGGARRDGVGDADGGCACGEAHGGDLAVGAGTLPAAPGALPAAPGARADGSVVEHAEEALAALDALADEDTVDEAAEGVEREDAGEGSDARRDRAAADRVAGGAPAASDEAREVSARIRRSLDLVVDPARGREPDDELAVAARTVLERVVAHGRRDRQAPALTVLALLAWWSGDAVLASVLVERALDQDPGHRLAELLDRALGAGLPPGWVRRRC